MFFKKNTIIFFILAGLFLFFFHFHPISDFQNYDHCTICYQQGTLVTPTTTPLFDHHVFEASYVNFLEQVFVQNTTQSLEDSRAPPFYFL